MYLFIQKLQRYFKFNKSHMNARYSSLNFFPLVFWLMICCPPRNPRQNPGHHCESSFWLAFIPNELSLTISSTSKTSLNLFLLLTAILIFSLLDYCHSFLMGLPVSRVTTFYSTHWTVPECAFWITNLILSLTQLTSSSGSQLLAAWKFKLLSTEYKYCFQSGFCIFSL